MPASRATVIPAQAEYPLTLVETSFPSLRRHATHRHDSSKGLALRFILLAGSMPLDLLEARVDRWIAAQGG